MIRIYVGDEPATLVEARERYLTAAVLSQPKKRDLVGYTVATGRLEELHWGRCAYCEIWMRDSSGQIDHYRPKGEAFDIDWSETANALSAPHDETDDDRDRFGKGLPPADRKRVIWTRGTRGYWWLTWTWENLLWACGGCNSAHNKGTRFPLRRSSPILRQNACPPGDEQPLLIDPCREDPMDRLEFRKIDSDRWKLFARRDDSRGEWTITLLGLNQPRMMDQYRHHVKRLEVQTRIERHHLDAASSDEQSRRKVWCDLCQIVLAPENPLLALGHDWINACWPSSVRKAWGVTLDRPSLCLSGVPHQSTMRPRLPSRPELANLPSRLALRIRAQRYLANLTQERREVITALIKYLPEASDEEIAGIVNCNVRDVQRCRTP